MKKQLMLLVLALFLIIAKSRAQTNPNWILVSQTAEIDVFMQNETYQQENSDVVAEYSVYKFVNKTKFNFTVEWDLDLAYSNLNLSTSPEEKHFQIQVPANSSIEGNPDPKVQLKQPGLVIFRKHISPKFLAAKSDILTRVNLINFKLTPIH